MEILINDDLYIKDNNLNISLAKYKGKDKKGQDKWEYIAHKHSISSVLRSYRYYIVRTCDAKSFGELREVFLRTEEVIQSIDDKLDVELSLKE